MKNCGRRKCMASRDVVGSFWNNFTYDVLNELTDESIRLFDEVIFAETFEVLVK